MYNYITKNKYLTRSFDEGMNRIQRKLYHLFFEFTSDPDTFVQRVVKGEILDRSLTQVSTNSILYNFTRLLKIKPEIIVWSILQPRGFVEDAELQKLSEVAIHKVSGILDDENFYTDEVFYDCLNKLRLMELVE